MKTQRVLAIAVCVALGVAGRASSAPDDPIDVEGATISVGDAPTQGVVVIDAAAAAAQLPDVPSLEPLPGAGSFFTSMPAAPSTGNGSGGAFYAASSQTLAGGTHHFTTFDVASGAVVTATGAVTILVTGNANVFGELWSPASIDVVCGGNLVVGPGAAVDVDAGTLTLDAGGDVRADSGSKLSTSDAALTVRARGLSGAGGSGDVTFTAASLNSVAGTILVQAARSFSATGSAYVGSVGGDVVFQAFGGDVSFREGAGAHATSAPNGVRAEAANSITLAGAGTLISQTGGLIRGRAFGGTLDLTDGAQVRLTAGEIDLGAGGAVRVTDTARIQLTSGTIRVTSFGGDVVLTPTGGADCIRTTTGPIDVAAAKSLRFEGAGVIGSTSGDIRAAAHDGDLTISSGAAATTSGRVDLLASGALTVNATELRGWSGIALVAGDGGIGFGTSAPVDTQAGGTGFRAVATGAVMVRGSLSTRGGDLVLASRDGTVDVAGGTLTTLAELPAEVGGAPPPSPSISIESFAGAAGHISAAAATIESGDSGLQSGDVRLVIHESALAVPFMGFVAPDKVTIVAKRARPARSTVDASGWLDAGPGGSLLGGTATLSVGGVQETVSVTRVGSRGAVRIRGPHARMDVKASKNGSSRARFRLVAQRDFTRYLSADASGPLVISLAAGSVATRSAVHVDRRKFQAARARGALAAPRIYPARCDVRVGGNGNDVLVVEVALGDLGVRPTAAPDVVVRFGAAFVARIPGSAFAPSGDTAFTATGPIPGVRRATLDYARGVLSFEADSVGLSVASADGGLTAVVAAGLGRDERAVQVRLGRSGHGFRY